MNTLNTARATTVRYRRARTLLAYLADELDAMRSYGDRAVASSHYRSWSARWWRVERWMTVWLTARRWPSGARSWGLAWWSGGH